MNYSETVSPTSLPHWGVIECLGLPSEAAFMRQQMFLMSFLFFFFSRSVQALCPYTLWKETIPLSSWGETPLKWPKSSQLSSEDWHCRVEGDQTDTWWWSSGSQGPISRRVVALEVAMICRRGLKAAWCGMTQIDQWCFGIEAKLPVVIYNGRLLVEPIFI